MVDSVNIFPKHLLRIGYPAVLLPLLLLFCAACTCSDEQKSEDTPAIKKSTEESTRESKSTPEYIHAALQVVTLSGEALSGMLPIATLQPNAFDAPIATGKPTDTTGKSSLRFPIDQKAALRAWDPDLLYFPNNFYEVLPQSGIIEKTLVISMVKSASIDAVLIG
ncbi:MAG: hypothetical protein KAH38_01295, partial [Candidatus Hydrogenedentes bacterium]|nr:hypothetical protein [Candidatus Hydrogenedentota bacterium]